MAKEPKPQNEKPETILQKPSNTTSKKIEINSASVDELITLPGIGAKKVEIIRDKITFG
ncbi:MAG: hypothetical protein ACE5JB_08375 [bacterium]